MRKLRLHKQLLESTHQVFQFNQPEGDQLYQEGFMTSGVLDATTQASWGSDHRQHRALALQHEPSSTNCQRNTSNATDCMEIVPVYGKHIEGSNHGQDINFFNGLKEINHPNEKNKDKLGIELDTNCSTSMEYGDNQASLTTSFLSGNRLPLVWPTNSNATSSKSIMNVLPTRYHFFQPPFELEDISNGNGSSLHRHLDIFRSQNSSGAAHSMQEYNQQ